MDEGLDLSLPTIERVEYLRDMMASDRLGWCSFDQMGGIHPHSWVELKGFSDSLDLKLEPWEFSAIRAMSVSYVEGYARGKTPMTVSPAFVDSPSEDPGLAAERRKISDQLKAAFRQRSHSK